MNDFYFIIIRNKDTGDFTFEIMQNGDYIPDELARRMSWYKNEVYIFTSKEKTIEIYEKFLNEQGGTKNE